VKRVSHILCPTDFSPLSKRTTRIAIKIAEDLRAKLTILHVDDITLMNVTDFMVLEGLRRESRRRIEKRLSALKNNQDLSRARFVIEEGNPHEVIVDQTQKLGANLVVMGTHGESGWHPLHLGSIAERVLHVSKVPVLFIPEIGKREPFRRKTKRILLAADLGHTEEETINYAVELAKRFEAELEVLNVAYPSDELFPELGSFWARSEFVEIKAELEQKRTEALEKLIPPSAKKKLKVRMAVKEGEPHEVIDLTAHQRRIDLLVMGAQGRGQSELHWIGSTTQKVLRLGACATLVVK
jgi:nucleotide-binding universal stress UspA family protein